MSTNLHSILIVDDEPLNLKRAAMTLHKHYQLHFAKSGPEALAFLQNTLVDLVLLDIVMPEMDGFAVAKKLAKSEETAAIPVIYLTGDNSEQRIEKAFETGASDYITKPFRDKELLARIRNRLETEILKHKVETALAAQAHLLEIINDYVLYMKTDLQGNIVEISHAFCHALGCQEAQLLGKNMRIFKTEHTPEKLYKELWHTLKNRKVFTTEIENKNFLGSTNWYRVTISPDVNAQDELTGYMAFYNNIDDQVRYQQDSYSDFLTGINNRAMFERELTQEIYRAKRYAQVFSLIMLDIDYFKLVNDRFGHHVGDSFLVELTELIKANIRHSDILARWGGEEFILLCSNTNQEDAQTMAELLRKTIETHEFDTVGQKTASFGVIEFKKHFDQKSLFRKVDRALYMAKEGGRNQVVCWQEPTGR